MQDRLSGRTLVVAAGHDLSLALLEGDALLAAIDRPMDRGHAEAVVPSIAELLAPFGGPQAGVRDIVVETGPGSFTGLRVGLAAATALGLAWNARLSGVRSTQLVAAKARSQRHFGPLMVALLAPRGQVWVEGFAAGGMASLGAPVALPPAEATARLAGAELVAGTACGACGVPGLDIRPSAAAVVHCPVDVLGPAELLYVRVAGADAA